MPTAGAKSAALGLRLVNKVVEPRLLQNIFPNTLDICLIAMGVLGSRRRWIDVNICPLVDGDGCAFDQWQDSISNDNIEVVCRSLAVQMRSGAEFLTNW